MPRATQSKVGSIVQYFRTEDLKVANLAFELVRDALRERNAKAQKAKAPRKATPAEVATAPPPAPTRKVKKAKKKAQRKRTQTQAQVEQVLDGAGDGIEQPVDVYAEA